MEVEPLAAPPEAVATAAELRAQPLSPEAVAAKRNWMRQQLAKPVVPYEADPAASYFDRRLIEAAQGGHPGVEQAPLGRYQPGPRTDLTRLESLKDPENADLVQLQIERGRDLGGQTFYPSTYPIRARYGELNTPVSFQDFAFSNAATSPQRPLPVNIPNATVLTYMKAHDIEPTYENFQRIQAQQMAQGSKSYSMPEDRLMAWNDYLKGGPWSGFDKRQKISSYGQNLYGNLDPLTFDTHKIAGTTMGTPYAPYFEPMNPPPKNYYGKMEDIDREHLAGLAGDPAATRQANQWFGAGELTGLRSPPGDFLQTFENIVRKNAQLRGWDTGYAAMQQKVNDILAGKEVLWPLYGKSAVTHDPTLFGKVGTRAEGGPVEEGDPTLVGERGPEIFVPDRPGTVIPNHMLGGKMNVDPQAARRHMIAQMLAQQGRNGDSMLAHINPREATALKKGGGSGTINPRTGLAEFYGGGYGNASGGTNAGDPSSP
ncbi:MAG TPA: hypothetical protein VGH25_04130, partial [Dongiaceae bacterium]